MASNKYEDLIRRKESITQLVRSKENVKAYSTVEKRLIGKLLFVSTNQRTLISKLGDVSEDMFTNYLHRMIFRYEKKCLMSNFDIDISDLNEALSKDQTSKIGEAYEKAGSSQFITQLMSLSNGNSVGTEGLFDKLKKLYQKNNLINDTIKFLNELDVDKEPRELERNFLKISESLSQLNQSSDEGSQPFKEVLESWNQLIYEQRLSENNLGVDVGYEELDKKLGGIRPGQFIVLGARPGTGKTAFALNLVQNIINQDQNKNILMFSLEMNSFELIERIVSMNTGINNRYIRTNQLTDLQWADISSYVNENKENVNFYINDNPGLSMSEIETEINKVLEQVDNIDLVVIDYLQLISSRIDNRQQAVANISRKSKLLAKKYHLPILSLSQLSRAGVANGSRPGLESLRESGQIEQDADIVMMLSPKEEKDDDDENEGGNDATDNISQITCDVVKNRSGNRGPSEFIFHKDISLFKETEPEPEAAPIQASDNKSVNIGDIFSNAPALQNDNENN